MNNNILLSDKELNIDNDQLYHSLIKLEFAKKNENEINENTFIVDFKLNINEFQEKKYFKKYPNLKKYFTRGLSFLIHEGSISILRKGLIKFFKYEKNLKLELNQNHSLIVMNKEDGQNVQITYEEKIKSLIICSKNVSIICNNLNDLEKYRKEERFSLNIKVSEFFLKNYKLTKDLLTVLKKYILVGEYIGDLDNLIINYYDKIGIKFFTLIKKNEYGNDKPLENLNFIKKLGLDIINYTYYKNIDFENFINIIKDIENQSLNEVGEGKVFYLLENDILKNMYKVKSNEFKIFNEIKINYKNKEIKLKEIYPQNIEFYKKIIYKLKNLNLKRTNYFPIILTNIIQNIKDSNKIELNRNKWFLLKNMPHLSKNINRINKNKQIVLMIPIFWSNNNFKIILEKMINERGFNFKFLSFKENNLNNNNYFERLKNIIINYNEKTLLFIYIDKIYPNDNLDIIFDIKKEFEFLNINFIKICVESNRNELIYFKKIKFKFDYEYIINTILALINDNNLWNEDLNLNLKYFFNYLAQFKNKNYKNILNDFDIENFKININKYNIKNFKNILKIKELINNIVSKIDINMNDNILNNNLNNLMNLIKNEKSLNNLNINYVKNINKFLYKFTINILTNNWFKDNNSKKNSKKKNKNVKNKLMVPIYYGIFINKKVNMYELLKKHKINLNENDRNKFDLINELNVTCEFINKKSNIDDFKLDLNIDILLENIIYVENLCILTKVKVNNNDLKINNKFPHILLMINHKKLKIFESNSIMKIIKNQFNLKEILFKNETYKILIKDSNHILKGITKFKFN